MTSPDAAAIPALRARCSPARGSSYIAERHPALASFDQSPDGIASRSIVHHHDLEPGIRLSAKGAQASLQLIWPIAGANDDADERCCGQDLKTELEERPRDRVDF